MQFAVEGERLVVSDGDLRASAAPPVSFGHLGCRTLGKVLEDRKGAQKDALTAGKTPPPDLPPELIAEWDRKMPGWRKSKSATGDVGRALREAQVASRTKGLELWDTMRGGSDYWRPGKLLSDAAEVASVRVEYARLDELCPPKALLVEFRRGMTFPEYARQYSEWLTADSRIDLGVAAVVRAQARGLLAVFYCTDSFIPGYADPRELATPIPYEKRRWFLASDLRDEGCHRVVLADLIARRLATLGVGGSVLEIDPTTQSVKARRFKTL